MVQWTKKSDNSPIVKQSKWSTNWVISSSVGALSVGRNCSWTCFLYWFECCGTGDRTAFGAQGDCDPVWWSWPSTNISTNISSMEVHTRLSFPLSWWPSGGLSCPEQWYCHITQWHHSTECSLLYHGRSGMVPWCHLRTWCSGCYRVWLNSHVWKESTFLGWGSSLVALWCWGPEWMRCCYQSSPLEAFLSVSWSAWRDWWCWTQSWNQ